MTLTLTTAGDGPVTLAMAKRQVRAEYHTDDDAFLQGALDTATAWVQNHTGRSLAENEWTLTLNEFPAVIELPMPPVTGITSVTYLDAEGATQTLDTGKYRLFGKDGFAPFLRPSWAACWPFTARGEPDAVTIVFEAGAETIPPAVGQAILLLVGHLYNNREASSEAALKDIPFGVDALLKDYRQRAF